MPQVEARLGDASPLVRAMAVWALSRLAPDWAAAVRVGGAGESDPAVAEAMGEEERVNRCSAFGLGYSAVTLAKRFPPRAGSIAGTARDLPARSSGCGARATRSSASPAKRATRSWRRLAGTTHLLTRSRRDLTAIRCCATIAKRSRRSLTLEWIGYLSTVGVYGNQEGAVVDESTATQSQQRADERARRSRERWLRLARDRRPARVPARRHLRTWTERVRQASSRARRGASSSRAGVQPHPCRGHRERARSLDRQARGGAIYNVADDEPAAPGDVVAYAAELMGMPPPPEIAFAEADLTPMARSFYEGSRRIYNALIKSELGVKLRLSHLPRRSESPLADDPAPAQSTHWRTLAVAVRNRADAGIAQGRRGTFRPAPRMR